MLTQEQNKRGVIRMLRILRLILFGVWNFHEHEWVDDFHEEVVYRSYENNLPSHFIHHYYYKCKTCGLRKHQKFKE